MTTLRQLKTKRTAAPPLCSPLSTISAAVLFLAVVLVGALLSSRWIHDASIMSRTRTEAMTAHMITAPSLEIQISVPQTGLVKTESKSSPVTKMTVAHPIKKQKAKRIPKTIEPTVKDQTPKGAVAVPFACPTGNQTAVCMATGSVVDSLPASPTCPDYFRWIHEDLRPWKRTGVTRRMVEQARRTANFRLIVLNGKAYVERYRPSFQSRDVFTLWGILQLLRRYPAQVPDLDLMFDCVDWPVVKAQRYRAKNASAPPPLFRYCGDDSTLDIVFPDWSFWGWPEINIKPWELLNHEIKEGNGKVKWMDREPYAYWKGNPAVATTRQELLQCNISEEHDWNARIYAQDWFKESREGFKESDLASQCIHRYKIYIEGSAWSVSEKYILACDSMTLLVTPRYYDFFTRGLLPVQHYWPIKDGDKCRSIKFAVDWGNSHKQKAQDIGREASNFIQEKLSMDYVYDYMFHLLSEYSKLLKYKPTIPKGAVEMCAESMLCPVNGLEKKFMLDSLVKHAHDSSSCAMPPPYSIVELKRLERKKASTIKQVDVWEQRAREKQDKHRL